MDSCLFSGDGSLNPAGDCVNPGRHPEVVEGLVLLTDGIFPVYPGNFHVTFLYSLLQLGPLCLFLLVALL